MRKAGPWFQGSVILPATSMLWPTMPWCIGNAPVPIVAWICAVLVGDEPTVASVYHVPFGISDLVNGQAFGCASSTLMPPASHTSVTTSFGRSRPDLGEQRLGHRPAVGRMEPVELQQIRGGGGDAGGRDGPGDLALRLHEAGAVPEHGHGLDVVPRSDMGQAGAHEVGFLRHEGDLRAPIGTPPSPDAKQLFVGKGTRQLHQILWGGPRTRVVAWTGEERPADEREEQGEGDGATRRHVGIANTTPDRPDNRGTWRVCDGRVTHRRDRYRSGRDGGGPSRTRCAGRADPTCGPSSSPDRAGSSRPRPSRSSSR